MENTDNHEERYISIKYYVIIQNRKRTLDTTLITLVQDSFLFWTAF